MSPATIHHLETVFSIVRGIYGREHDDPVNDLDVIMAIWSIFMNATLQAAVHLGQDYEVNLRYVKNNLWNSVGQLFRETGKLISDQNEITGFRTIDFQEASWKTSLMCEKAYRFTNAKTKVFSDCVLCVGKWEVILLRTGRGKLNGIRKTITSKRWMNRIGGMPTEFEWKIFPGITALGLLEKIQKTTDRSTV